MLLPPDADEPVEGAHIHPPTRERRRGEYPLTEIVLGEQLELVAGGDLVEVEVGVRPVDETGSDATTQTKPWFTSARWIALTESMPWRDAPGGPLALAPSSVETLP